MRPFPAKNAGVMLEASRSQFPPSIANLSGLILNVNTDCLNNTSFHNSLEDTSSSFCFSFWPLYGVLCSVTARVSVLFSGHTFPLNALDPALIHQIAGEALNH